MAALPPLRPGHSVSASTDLPLRGFLCRSKEKRCLHLMEHLHGWKTPRGSTCRSWKRWPSISWATGVNGAGQKSSKEILCPSELPHGGKDLAWRSPCAGEGCWLQIAWAKLNQRGELTQFAAAGTDHYLTESEQSKCFLPHKSRWADKNLDFVIETLHFIFFWDFFFFWGSFFVGSALVSSLFSHLFSYP